jgi:hypothetical protein
VSYTTIRSVLNERGIYAFTPIKKPLLTKRHIQLRKEKTAKILRISDDDMELIIFSDECKFKMLYSYGHVKTWRRPGTDPLPKNITPTVKCGAGRHGMGMYIMPWRREVRVHR